MSAKRALRGGAVLYVLTAIAVVLLLAPSILVGAASFTESSTVAFPPRGFTLDWYRTLLQSPEILDHLRNSLIVGLVATLVGLLAGVPAALGLYRHRMRFAVLLDTALAFGFAAPVAVSGLGFLILYTQLRVLEHLPLVGVAVAIVNLPFMVWAVAAAVSGMNPELEEAASTLGAEEVQRFLFVTLPGIGPGILTGSLLMFIFAFTDFLLSLMLVNAENATLPVYLFGAIRGGISPVLAAVSLLYVIVAGLAFTVLVRKGRIAEFIERKPI